jgi:hypothetical protein
MAVLNSDSYSDIIAWSPDGKSFIFTDSNAFERVLLPNIFKVAKFDSFLRKVCEFNQYIFLILIDTGDLAHFSSFWRSLFNASSIGGVFPSVKLTAKLDVQPTSTR